MLSAFCPRARVSGGRVRPVAARVLLPLSVWVSFHLPHSIPPGSLHALLTRFRVLTPPRVRFAPVWPSTGRTVSERGMWWLYVVVAMLPRGASLLFVYKRAPLAASVAGALFS